MKELTATTLRSVALDDVNKKRLNPPKTLLKAIKELRNRDDTVVTKPDKGSGVVVMDKYLRLLSEASINDTRKFRHVNTERPKKRGRPVKYYHPLLQRQKQISAVIFKVLPKPIADCIRSKRSRLAHLYCLLKTHKEQLAMRPVLSATHTYNYGLAKWLDEKLKPLSCNQYTVNDTFEFVNKL